MGLGHRPFTKLAGRGELASPGTDDAETRDARCTPYRAHWWLPGRRGLVRLRAGGDGAVDGLFVDPGKYQYYNCEQLAEPRKRWTEREQELKLLMDKAEHSAGGTFVNVIAYQSDYAVAREELKVIESAARDKNCDKSRPGR